MYLLQPEEEDSAIPERGERSGEYSATEIFLRNKLESSKIVKLFFVLFKVGTKNNFLIIKSIFLFVLILFEFFTLISTLSPPV